MRLLLADLEEEHGPFHTFRPYRDTRFAKDKSPYKTQIAASGECEGGAAHYLQLSAQGLMAASGYYMLQPDQIARLREAVAADASGEELPGLLAAVEGRGLTVQPGMQEPLKRVPRGYPADHPRSGQLRWKALGASRAFGSPARLPIAVAKEHIAAAWEPAAPLNAWMGRHVGPSRELPLEIRARLGG